MKIVKNGKHKNSLNPILKGECEKCGCVFEEFRFKIKNKNYNKEGYFKSGFQNCPECDNKVEMFEV